MEFVVVVVAVEVVVVVERVDAVVDTWARVLKHDPTDATVASIAAVEHGEKISPLEPVVKRSAMMNALDGSAPATANTCVLKEDKLVV